MKRNLQLLQSKASFLLISAMLLFTSTAVYSQMVTSNLRINDEDVDHLFAGSRSLAVVGDNVYVVWADDRGENNPGNIYYTRSEDGGETFSDDIILSGLNDENLNMWPAIVADESGGIYVTWTGFTEPFMGPPSGFNIWFTKSDNEGGSFVEPIQITDNDASLFPSIGVYDDYVYVLYGDATDMPSADYFLARSTNGGISFHDPIKVNDEECIEEIAFDNFTSLDVDPLTGNIYLAWIDGRREYSKGDIFFAKSTDNGASIGDNIKVNSTETAWADEEFMNIKISVGEENKVYVGFVFENGDTRVILAESDDDGENFTSEGFLAGNDNYCYHYDIMALPDGTIGYLMITNLYDMGWNVWFAKPEESSIIFNDVDADFRIPSLFLANDGHVHAVWIDDREGEEERNLYYAKILDIDELFAGGSGISTEPWQIATIEHLNNVRYFTGDDHSDKYFIQIEDIDFEDNGSKDGEGWEPIGDPWESFMGNYDGNYKIIENLTINRPSEYFVGLFGYTRGATIENLGIINADVTGEITVGALIGEAGGGSVISNCYSTGIVTGSSDVGGLIGANTSADIFQSYSTADVSAGAYVGGLVGVNEEGKIENSYSTGNVSGSVGIGGLVGENAATIINSYSTGYVSGNDEVGGLVGILDPETITASYWDINTSGQEGSEGGEGKSTLEMISSATFGTWDFDDIWNIVDGISYPYLQWQGLAENHNYPPANVWTGDIDNNWANMDNWSYEEVPDMESFVLIPSGRANYPTVNGAANAYNLIMENGATIIDNDNLTIHGNFKMKHEIPLGGWNMISSPVENMVILGSDFAPDEDPLPADFDFYYFDESQSATPWINLRGAGAAPNEDFDNHFVIGKGYLVAYFEGSFARNPFSFIGDMNTGDVYVGIDYSSTPENIQGWNLIGNPYPSAIDWGAVVKEGIIEDDFAYIYNSNSNNYDEIEDGAIDANQGFFVKAEGSPGTLQFGNDNRIHAGDGEKGKGITDADKLTLHLYHGKYYDRAVIRVIEESGFNRDRRDALKLFSLAPHMPQIYSYTADDIKVAINSVPELNKDFSTMLGLYIPDDGEYTITAHELKGKFVNTPVYLTDLKIEKTLCLNDNPAYSFNAEKGDLKNRFEITFGKQGDLINIDEMHKALDANAWYHNSRLYIRTTEENTLVSVFDINGSEISSYKAAAGKSDYSFNLPAGVYLVRMTGQSAIKTNKIVIH